MRDFFTFEIPTRELYCPVTISGLNLKLIYCKQTTNVLLIFIISETPVHQTGQICYQLNNLIFDSKQKDKIDLQNTT